MVSSVATVKKSCLNCVCSVFTDFRPLTQVSRNYLFFGGEGGWRIHISLAAILEGVHMDEVEHDIMNYQNRGLCFGFIIHFSHNSSSETQPFCF